MSVRVSIRGMAVGAVVALAAWSAPAAAQGNPEAQLRQVITDVMNFLNAQSGGQGSVQTSRPIETRMDGGTAIATLPDLTTTDPRRGETVEFGTLTLSQREVAPGRLRYELSLPQRIRATPRTGAAPLTITSGGGTFSVVRDVASGIFYEVDFNVSDLHVPPPDPGAADTTIGRLQLGYAISGRPDGLSDAVSRFAMRGLRVAAARGMGGTAGEISLAFGVQGVRPEDIERIRQAYYEPATDLGQRWQHAFERARAIVTAGGVAGSTIDITVADGVYNDGNPQPAVTLGRAGLRMVTTDANQDEGTFQLQYQQDGLVLRPGLAPMPQYIPARANVNLQLTDLPMRALHELSNSWVAARGPGAAGNAMPSVMALLQAMQQADTTLNISPIDLEAPAVGATLNGTVTADGHSPFQAHATGELVVRGLEALQRELGGQGGRAGPNSPAGVVAMLVALGQQGTGANGQPVRTYRIELTPTGQLMLNGADMSALLGGAGGGAPGGRPPAGRRVRPPGPRRRLRQRRRPRANDPSGAADWEPRRPSRSDALDGSPGNTTS